MADGTETEPGANPTGEQQQQQQQQPTTETKPSGTDTQNQNADAFADLDQDTREWITKRGFKTPSEIAKNAYEQSKLLGNAIRMPGENATEEERTEFLNKLGRPETPDAYDFKPPASLPENLPYDGERAKSFAGLSHKIGLTKAQAAAVHDWAVQNAVEDFNGMTKQQTEQSAEAANAEVAKLEKLWGPKDGNQMRTNLSFADKALREIGGDEVLAEFQRVGLIGTGPGDVIKSAPIAIYLSKVGQTLYKEDEVIRGRPDRLNNPFTEGKDFNVTAQMRLWKQDRDAALSFIAAAGKKPEDFGLKA